MIKPTSPSLFGAAVVALSLAVSPLVAGQWSVPLAGNAFHRAPTGHRLPVAEGALQIENDKVYSVYFHVNRPGQLDLALQARVIQGQADIQAQVDDQKRTTRIQAGQFASYPLGKVKIAEPGYVRVDLQLDPSQRSAVAEIRDLIVTSDVEALQLDYVQSNQGNMFYWGRRGPSVHLQYQLPRDTPLTYAYSEITVPTGQDAIGSYFMANGFGEGYFGMQVNSETQRRILFSVWSPFHTDNPAEVPPEDRITTLAKGSDVKAQQFGNEGSGGQSYMVYPWRAGTTYRFLTEVTPDGEGNTRYTSWFGDKAADEWRLLASFLRPKTDKHLTGFHGFLENFIAQYGNVQRSAHYGNQWVRDTESRWHEIVGARLTGDNTARTRQRLDYAGGSEQDHFFLRNCGFFNDRVDLDQTFQRTPNRTPPAIDFDGLPRG